VVGGLEQPNIDVTFSYLGKTMNLDSTRLRLRGKIIVVMFYLESDKMYQPDMF